MPSGFYELTAEFVDEPRDGDIEFGLYVLLFPTVHSPRRVNQKTNDHD